MRRSFRRNRKAVSPVIATIIIVAIAIVMSIAVAYWVLGLGASFTKYEKLQFISAYAPNNSSIAVVLKNTGTATATLDTSAIFINGVPGGATTWTTTSGNLTMTPGQQLSGTIGFAGLPSGTNVEVMLQTTSGGQYPKTVVLP